MLQDTYRALGRILALVDHAVRVAAGDQSRGLTAHAINKCLDLPREELLGVQMRAAMPAIRANRWLDRRLGEAMDQLPAKGLDDIPTPVPLAAQGTMQLAYYHERSAIQQAVDEMREAKVSGAGALRKGSAVDWGVVDWSVADWTLSDAELARTHGVTRQAARAARKRHGGA